jgi:hypothetical protein
LGDGIAEAGRPVAGWAISYTAGTGVFPLAQATSRTRTVAKKKGIRNFRVDTECLLG